MEKKLFIKSEKVIVRFIELNDNLDPIPKTRVWSDAEKAREWVKSTLLKRKVSNIVFEVKQYLEIKMVDDQGRIF